MADIHRKSRDHKYNSPSYTYITKMCLLSRTRVYRSEDSDTNQSRPFLATSSIYTSSVEFRRAIPDPGGIVNGAEGEARKNARPRRAGPGSKRARRYVSDTRIEVEQYGEVVHKSSAVIKIHLSWPDIYESPSVLRAPSRESPFSSRVGPDERSSDFKIIEEVRGGGD